MKKEVNKIVLVEKVFEATKTVYDDEDKFIEGYDGVHSINVLFFDTDEECENYVMSQTVHYGEISNGSTWELLYRGFVNNVEVD